MLYLCGSHNGPRERITENIVKTKKIHTTGSYLITDNAMKYLLTGIKFDSNEAFRMNLIQEIHETKDLFTRAVELAGFICSASTEAIKEVIKNSRIAQINQETAINEFNSVQNKLIKGKDFKEGLKSFLEKREPYFRN